MEELNNGAKILAGRLLNIAASNAGQPVNGHVPDGYIPFRYVVELQGRRVQVDLGFHDWDKDAPPRVARLFRDQFRAATLEFGERT